MKIIFLNKEIWEIRKSGQTACSIMLINNEHEQANR